MAIRFVNLAIRRDELTLTHTSVAEWEVPLLYLVHGEEMVSVLPGEPWADRDPPEVTDEYRRLEAKYKTPPEDDGRPGQRAVGLVYGAFGASPQLRQAIEAATFERPADLLGIADIEKAATEAETHATKLRVKADRVKAASEADTTTAEPAEKVKTRKVAATRPSLL